jgi:hypothetical protein
VAGIAGVQVRENPNAARTWATFRLWGETLDPHEVSRAMGIAPSAIVAAGEWVSKRAPSPYGGWNLSSEHQLDSTDLEQHIAWLLVQLEPVQSILAPLLADPAVHCDVFCMWESATGHGGPVFSPLLLRRLGALGAELGLDIYFADEP